MTLFQLDRLPSARQLASPEATSLYDLSNKIYDVLEPFGMAERRRDDMVSVMIEAATKFLEKGL